MEFLNYEKRVDTTDISYIVDGFKNGTIKDGDKITVKGYLHRIREIFAAQEWFFNVCGKKGFLIVTLRISALKNV